MFRFKSTTLSLALCAVVAFTFACTKGHTVGGTDDNPAAVDTGGVPDLPEEHGAATGEHAGAEGTAAHATSTAAAGPARFDIGLTEYKILIENQPATGAVMNEGDFLFHVTNHGKEEHGLEIQGAGTENKFTLKPGESHDVAIHLKRGAYQFYCPVEGHKEEGMTLPINVQ
jgi:uncharacterized cupredoxin-like copper-binding protein